MVIASRLTERTGSFPAWSAKNVANLKTIVAWVEQTGGDARALTNRLMDGFLADAWAASKSFPIGALAANPAKYAHGPSTALPARSGPVHGLNAKEDV